MGRNTTAGGTPCWPARGPSSGCGSTSIPEAQPHRADLLLVGPPADLDGGLLRKVHTAGQVEHLPLSMVGGRGGPSTPCVSLNTYAVPEATTQAGKGGDLSVALSDEVLLSRLSMGSHPVSPQNRMRVTTPTRALSPSFMGGSGTLTATSTRCRTFPLHVTHESNHHRAPGSVGRSGSPALLHVKLFTVPDSASHYVSFDLCNRFIALTP